ncbi:MAG: adenylate/guanylate cyclase domain-containing protein [Geminicoccaceae bacterium]
MAILATDVAGYSRLMGQDEEGTLAALKAIRRELGDPKVKEHRGRIVKTTGDGLLIEFASVVDAVRCAVEMQEAMAERNAVVPQARQIAFRMGINLGDVIMDEGDIFGDGVNVAARLEALAEPGGICVSQLVRDQVRDKLDVVFEDLGEQGLKNITRPVHVYRVRPSGPNPSAGDSEGVSPPALPLPEKPSIAILPFQNMSGDPEQEYFTDGMVEEITTAIARLPWLFVIARNSSFTYKGKAVDVKQVARELGVRYVLEGSVRKAGNRVRITGQLIDATSGAHLWADRFDGALDDIFELQDKVAASVAGAIEPKLRGAETERASRKPPGRLDAYDLYLRAMAEFQKYTADGMNAGVGFCTRALAIDPTYPPAAALLGYCRLHQIFQGWGPVSPMEVAEAVRLARLAIEAGKDDPDALVMGGDALSYFTGDRDLVGSAVERALALNPNSALAWCLRGWAFFVRGQPEAAIEAFQKSMRLSPLDPFEWLSTGGIAFANAFAGRYETAIEWADRCLRGQPRLAFMIRLKAAACATLDRMEEARECVRLVLAIDPAWTIAKTKSVQRHVTAAFDAFMVEGLHKAGLPEN